MRGAVLDGVIRPSIRLASLIIFVFFVSRAGFSGNGPLHLDEFPPKFNFPENIVQSAASRSSSAWEGYVHDTSRPVRRLLDGVFEGDEVTQKDGELKLYSEEPKYVGEILQLPDFSRENGTEVKAGIPVEKVTKSSACTDAWDHPGYSDACSYVMATQECSSGTLIEYTKVFYCFFKGRSVLAYTALGLWLAILFYMLGHTAHHYFCVSMDELSKILGMSPTLAGVTLLPFGNGAPDVFASIAAFVGHSGQGQVGLNSILGGAMFVSSVVAGSVSLSMIATNADVKLDRGDFLRDVGFFLFTLATLTGILFDGVVHLSEAVAYLAIYAVYVCMVALVEYLRWRFKNSGESRTERLLPDVDPAVDTSLSRGRVARNVDIGRQQSLYPILQPRDEQEAEETKELRFWSFRELFHYFIELPLNLPRRLTIPLIADSQPWSKFYAVCSVTFAPILLAMVWDGSDDGPFGSALAEYIVAGSVGTVLGFLSVIFLDDRPPQMFKAVWAAGGFIMSMVWFYLIAVELVAVLVALGAVWKIDPAIFGLTVLAWGNSIGDLMSNLALVSHGDDRIQTSFSGCYAGPMFNTLIGIGVSFLLKCWTTYPAPFAIPDDSSLFLTLAFLVTLLVWALITLLSRDMRPTKVFAVGSLILYTAFLVTRVAYAMDLESFLGGIK